jgi:hypothetical protein
MKFKVYYGGAAACSEKVALTYHLHTKYCSVKAARKAWKKYKPALLPDHEWECRIIQEDQNGLSTQLSD